MTEKKLYLILQSMLCVLLVILLSAAAVSIYRDGKARKTEDPMAQIYTRETAAEKFSPIAPLFFGAIGLTAAGWILAVKDDNADKPVEDAGLARDIIVSRVSVPDGQMKQEQQRQKKLLWTGRALFLLCMIPVGLYIADGRHFPDGSLEEMIASLAAHIFPWIIPGLSCLIVSTVLQEKSILRETAAAKAQIKAEKESGIKQEPKAAGPAAGLNEKRVITKNPGSKRALQTALIIAAIIFIVLGVMNGSAKAVLTKAVNICSECIGLG